MYLDEVKLNSFKAKDAKGNLIKEYNFNSFIRMEYKTKMLNGKSYGALVISNYGTFNDLKKIQYSTNTYNGALVRYEQFIEFDNSFKDLFDFQQDQYITFSDFDSGYLIDNKKLSLILEPYPYYNIRELKNANNSPATISSIVAYFTDIDSSKSFSIDIPKNTANDNNFALWSSGWKTAVFSFSKSINFNFSSVNGMVSLDIPLSNYSTLLTELKKITCSKQDFYSSSPKKLLEKLKLFFTAEDF